MLPDVPSMIVPPGLSSPFFSASSIIFKAIRSLMELPGLKVSTLTSTSAVTSLVMRLRRTSGVSPMASRIVLQIFLFVTDPRLYGALDGSRRGGPAPRRT